MRILSVDTQKGLSLVELMVAMVLGLLITAAVVQLFLTNRQTFNLQQGIASVQEQGRFAVDFLSKEVMGAGNGAVSGPINFTVSEDTPYSEDNNTVHDKLVILLAQGADCSGGAINEVDGESLGNVTAWKEYSVRVEDDGNGVLLCRDSDGSANVLIDNVEAFQVLYGVTDRVGNQTFYRYVNRNNVDPSDEITSVRFAVLLASDEVAVMEKDQAQDIEIFGASYANDIDFYDGRLRRLFVSSVALRNVAGGG